MPKVQTVSVISFLSFGVIVGALVFSRGFLLNRQVIHETAKPCRPPHSDDSLMMHLRTESTHTHIPKTFGEDSSLLSSTLGWCNPSPTFPKVVMILVDALRFDFVQRMEFLSAITKRNKEGEGLSSAGVSSSSHTSCSFKFVADPPTTTMQRLKALMTGTMPTFIDASANFNSYEVEEDSLIYQLYSMGKRIAFLGDDTWLSLFPKRYFKSPFVEAHPSFNAWDLDTVDRAVNKTMRTMFNEQNREQWDVLISHLLGVDHCGHRYGPSHPEMDRKLHEADSLINFVYKSMDNETLLVVFGDHGMTATGDHGGDSKDEVESTVIFISKQSSSSTYQKAAFQCPVKQISISQIDLVPSLSSLLGIPIPYSSIGQIIPGFLQESISASAIASNVAQIHQYIHHFPSMLHSSTEGSNNLVEQYKKIEEAFRNYQTAPNFTTREKLQRLSEVYLKNVKSVAMATWTRFNLPMIYSGVFITLLSISSLFLYLTSPPVTFRGHSSIAVLSWLWPSLSHWSVLCTFVYHAVASTALLGIVVSTVSGLSIFMLTLIVNVILRLKWKKLLRSTFSRRNISTFSSLCLYGFTCLAVFSNSFIVYEAQVLGFTLCSVVLIELLSSMRVSLESSVDPKQQNQDAARTIVRKDSWQNSINKKAAKCAWSCYVLLLILMRISSIFFRCREEQQEYCSEELLLHKQISSLPEDWLVDKYVRYIIALLILAIFVVSLRNWMMFRNCIFSKKPRAIVTRFIPSLLVVFLGVFWALQGLPYVSPSASKIPLLMSYLPIAFQVIAISSIVCITIRPICCVGHLRQLTYANSKKVFAGQTIIRGRDNSKHLQFPSAAKQRKVALNGLKHPNTSSINGGLRNGGQNMQIEEQKILTASSSKENTTITFPSDIAGNVELCDCCSEDTYSSCLLTLSTLITLLLVQVTSTGIAPAIIVEAYLLICLIGICKKSDLNECGSWSSAVAWTLTSQYFFYASGHQPIFSAIPWDSAFLGGSDGTGLSSTANSWIPWLRAGLAVIGNLHVSQILSSVALPLLVYWSTDKKRVECLMGKEERQKAYILYGRFLALHGLKLLMCMACACWQRRHLMVWKIFAPKFIFEAVSFIVTTFMCLLGMVFVTRLNYCHQKCLITAKTV